MLDQNYDYKLKAHCEIFRGGRAVVAYGTGIDAEKYSRYVNLICGEIAFYISKDYSTKSVFLGKPVLSPQKYNPQLHYIVILSSKYKDEIVNELLQNGANEIDFCDYPGDGFLPYDIDYCGTQIGKYTYLRPLIQHSLWVKSAGRFCSINATAQFVMNHPARMISAATVAFHRIFSEQDINEWHRSFSAEHKNPTSKVEIGNDVWIGAGVVINASRVTRIGDGAFIGSNAVVMDDVPPYAVVVGAPARIVKYRFNESEIKTLLRMEWWNWDEGEIKKNAALFIHPELFFGSF